MCLAEDSSEESAIESKDNFTFNKVSEESFYRPSKFNQRKDRNEQLEQEMDDSSTSVLEEEVQEIENGAFEEDINEVKIERKNPNSKKLLLEDSSQSDETSSSEEVLLHCGDTILSQPVVPHENCNASNADYSLINYTVEKDGFYTVIFSSSFEQVWMTIFSLWLINARMDK